ncbi:MAG: GGDEF domain-containing protein [Dactylosporangium sp.]|nr:sensor domain-containing diguanylate cyclase [Dactylosporangium sp.]NNJ61671.1 GGDEF domain-containing protein [Dactylosporangium sp.]
MAGFDGSAAGPRLAGWLFGTRDPAASRKRDGRIAGVLLLVAAVYAALVVGTGGGAEHRGVQLGLTAAYTMSATVCFLLPWRALPDWAVQAVAVWWVLLLTLAEGILGGALGAYVVGYVLVFVYTGMNSRPRTVLALGALAELMLLVAAGAGSQRSDLPVLAASVLVAVGIGQLPALAVVRSRRTDELVDLVRQSLDELSAVDVEEDAANHVASLATRLLDADEAVVLLTEHPGSTTYVWHGGHGAVGSRAELRTEAAQDRSGLEALARTGRTMFVADVTPAAAASHLPTWPGMASALYLPLPGEGSLVGVVIVWWTTPRPGVDSFSQRLVEVMTVPVGQTLQGLRQAKRLESPAMRDPLTGVGNRRRFDLALTDLPAGGTVLLFDLDAFAALNDMYGRETGDAVLRGFADAVRQSVRQNDVVTRFADDTFAVVLAASANSIASGIIIERLQRAWRSPQGCRFSVGVGVRTADESPAETLVRAGADLRATKRLKAR